MGHSRKNIAFLAAKIALQLDNRCAPGDVDAPAIVDEIAFVLQFVEGSAEAPAQQFGDQPTQCLVARTRRHRADDLGEAVAPPATRHFSSTIVDTTVAVEVAKKYDREMSYIQTNLFAQDSAERNRISEDVLIATRVRLEAMLA